VLGRETGFAGGADIALHVGDAWPTPKAPRYRGLSIDNRRIHTNQCMRHPRLIFRPANVKISPERNQSAALSCWAITLLRIVPCQWPLVPTSSLNSDADSLFESGAYPERIIHLLLISPVFAFSKSSFTAETSPSLNFQFVISFLDGA